MISFPSRAALPFLASFLAPALAHGSPAAPFEPPRALDLRIGAATAAGLAAADFDEDGIPDLAVGIVGPPGGSILLFRGNPDAIFPNASDAQQRRRQGVPLLSPFLPDSMARLDGAPADLLVAGDFDADGHADLAAGWRGGTEIRLAFGDGSGRLDRRESLSLAGGLRAMAAADVNRRDGLPELLVGLAVGDGGELLVFESPAGAARARAERFPAAQPVSAVAAGDFDGDFLVDVAAAEGDTLVVVHGRDRKLSLDEQRRSAVPPAFVERRRHPERIDGLAAGPFLAADGGHDGLALLDASGGLMLLPHSGRPLPERDLLPLEVGGRAAAIGVRSAPALLVPGGWNGESSSFSIVVGRDARQAVVASEEAGGRSKTGRFRPFGIETGGELLAALPMRLSADARPALLLAVAGSGAPVVVRPTIAATFTVDSAADTPDAVVGDGNCADAGGACTLRAALQEANATPAADQVSFAIPAAVPVTIQPATTLPYLTTPVILDATTQPGFTGTPAIELDFQLNTAGSPGLVVQATSTIRGFAVNRCNPTTGYGIGISLQLGGGTILEGNHVGTDPSGMIARPNKSFGIDLHAAVTGATIGGTTAAARNVVSANQLFGIRLYGNTSNTIAGNYLGLAADGVAPLGNVSRPIDFAPGSNVTLGGTAAGSRNVISANGSDGVSLSGSTGGQVPTAVLVQGNYIGTDASGTLDRGNSGDGVRVEGSLNVIGGTTPAARNVISGNSSWGIQIATMPAVDVPTIQGNYIGTNAAGSGALGNSFSGIRHLAPGLVIGGSTAGAGNVISGNTNHGIESYSGTTGSAILGNRIGTGADGTTDLGNGLHGILVYGAPALQVGGTAAGAGNQVSGNNQSGISVQLAGSAGTVIEGNLIGVAANGTTPLANSLAGVQVASSATGVRVGGTAAGAGNVIAGNGSAGVTVSSGVGSAVARNSIFSNGGIGIDLGATGNTTNDTGDPDSGANRLQNKPVLSCASLVSGGLEVEYSLDTLTSNATYPFAIEFFEADSTAGGEGRTFLGSDTWTSADLAAGTRRAILAGAAALGVASGDPIVATATDAAGNTSEFSAVRSVRAGLLPPPQVSVGGAACGTAPTIPDATPTLVWTDVPGESSYLWEIRTGSCAGPLVTSGTTAANVTATTLLVPLADGTYFWRIRARGDSGVTTCDGAWSCACSFTVACPPVPTPTQLSVDAQGCGGAIASADPSPALAWSDVAGESGYSWEVWTGAGCTGTRLRQGTTASDVVSASVTPDLPGGTYSWRIRADGNFNTNCASPWSCGCPFTQPCLDLRAPTQTTVSGWPCGSSPTMSDPTPYLAWNDVAGESGYEWEVRTGTDCSGSVVANGTLSSNATAITVGTQLPDGVYSWRIRAVGDGTAWCTGPWSCSCPFTISCVEVTTPAQLAVDAVACDVTPVSASGATPNLSWSDTPDDSGYEWEIWSGAGCSGSRVASGSTPTGVANVTVGVPLLGGTYSWRVRALGDEFSTCASPWVCGCPFTVPCLVAPAPAQTTVDGQACGPFVSTADTTPTLAWGAVAGATGYAWEIRSGVLCSGTLVASGTTAAGVTSVDPPALAVGTYHWQVRALGDGAVICDGPFACGCPFTVGTPACDGTAVPGGTISGAESWALSGSPYVVASTVTVAPSGSLSIAPGVVVKFAPGAGLLVEGTLVAPGTTTDRIVFTSIDDHAACGPTAGGDGNPAAGDWFSLTVDGAGASLAGTGLVIRYAGEGLRLSSGGTATVSSSTIAQCVTDLIAGGDSSPVFTNLDLVGCSTCLMLVSITGDSKATFTGGTWDGAGFLDPIGLLAYNNPGTPDPVFSGVTITNSSPWGHNALDIQDYGSGIAGTTHWAGIDFRVNNTLAIAPGGRVDVADADLVFTTSGGAGIDVSGILNLGAAGAPTTLRSGSITPGSSDWAGVRYLDGSTGSATNATIRHAATGLDIRTSGAVVVSSTGIEACGTGVRVAGSSAPTFTDLDLVGCSTCMSLLRIEGSSTPTFDGGTWDGAGFQSSAGELVYNNPGTPDPVFSGITIANMAPWGHNALDIADYGTGIVGTTHWDGLDFRVTSSLAIAPGGRVDVADADLVFAMSGVAGLEVSGILNLGAAGAPVTLRSGSGTPGPWDWAGVRYLAGSSGSATNATIRHASTGLEVQTSGSVVFSSSEIAECGTGVFVLGTSAPTFTDVDLTGCSTCTSLLGILGSSTPVFNGGTWDGAGFHGSAGALVYGNPGTPDPVFSGVTITNMAPWGQNVLDIADFGGGIAGTTHWAGLDFGVSSALAIAPGGRVDAANATLVFSTSFAALEVSGVLNLGAAGAPVTLRSGNITPGAYDWSGIRYLAGSSGTATNATIRHASTGLDIRTSGTVVVSSSDIEECGSGVRTAESAAPLLTKVDLTGCSTCSQLVQIEGDSTPVFSDGTWDGAGFHGSAGYLAYNNPGTPDPVFSGITITNMAPWGNNALDITDYGAGIASTTHWAGIDFRVNTTLSIAPGGQVDAADTTILFSPSGAIWLGNSGILNLGAPGLPITLRSASATPTNEDWSGVRYLAGSSGTLRNATVIDATTALGVSTSGAVRVESSRFERCQTAVRTTGTAQPDLGSGGAGSPGGNVLVGDLLDFDNGSSSPVSARFNRWSCPATAQMDAGMTDIGAIEDFEDNPSLGKVDFSDWLGGSHREALASADVSGMLRDVVLDWPDEPTATLTILRGVAPDALSTWATTTAGTWRDVGALDHPAPTLYYDVTGPCP